MAFAVRSAARPALASRRSAAAASPRRALVVRAEGENTPTPVENPTVFQATSSPVPDAPKPVLTPVAVKASTIDADKSAMDKVKDSASNTSEKIEHASEAVRDKASEIGSKVSEMAGAAGEKTSDAAAQVKASAEETAAKTKDAAVSVKDKTESEFEKQKDNVAAAAERQNAAAEKQDQRK